MARTLHLTTPPMHGEDVKKLQRALDKNKTWKTDFLQKAGIDGEYGLYTAQAVHRAKYWLGFKRPDKAAGPMLLGYLKGTTPLSPEMKKRRATRLKKKAATPLRVKALAQLKKHIGEKESPPGSNICPITKWWGIYGAWCAMGVSKAYIDAGSKSFGKSGSRYTGCSVMWAAAEMGRDGLSITKDPKPGDLVLMKWPGLSGYRADHVGMVEQARPLKTIECNTSPDSGGSQANGGMCCRKNREDERKAGIIKCYIHVSK